MGMVTLFKEGGMANLYEVEYNGKTCIKKQIKELAYRVYYNIFVIKFSSIFCEIKKNCLIYDFVAEQSMSST